jgi:nitrogen-specific signal transduction histidine kinase
LTQQRNGRTIGRLDRLLEELKLIQLPIRMNNAVSQVSAYVEDFPPSDGRSDHQQTGVDPLYLDELAHELRQPLSTIESLAYYLEITANDDRTCRHLQQIRLMVDRASRILDRAVA